MKAWRKRLRLKEGSGNVKQSFRMNTDLKESPGESSPINGNLTSCLKKPVCDMDGSTLGKMTLTSTESIAERTATTSLCSSHSKKVQFDAVEIRQYERIVSDNPCCSSGPPIG